MNHNLRPWMAIVMILAPFPGTVIRTRAFAAEWYKARDVEVQKVKQLREQVKTNPALRKEVETDAWQKLEAERDCAFSEMEYYELRRIHY